MSHAVNPLGISISDGGKKKEKKKERLPLRRRFDYPSDCVPVFPFHMSDHRTFKVLRALDDVCATDQVALVNSLIGKILCSPPKPDLKISPSSSRRSRRTLQKPGRIKEREREMRMIIYAVAQFTFLRHAKHPVQCRQMSFSFPIQKSVHVMLPSHP